MSVRLFINRPMPGFPKKIKQEAMVALWQAGFGHEEIAAALSLHASEVSRVLDLVRAHTGALGAAHNEDRP